MNIKEEFKNIKQSDITEKYISSIKTEKSNLSNSDKKFLLSIIGKFKEQDIEKILKAIKFYAIWEPDEAIVETRKKECFAIKLTVLEKTMHYILNYDNSNINAKNNISDNNHAEKNKMIDNTVT